MYMQQMLCLVTESINSSPRGGHAALKKQLDEALERLRFVHFASLAMLPGPPEAPARASLMLELAIDDGIAPKEAVRRLIDAASDTLWELYEIEDPKAHTAEARTLRLRGKLEPLAVGARAVGGFIGIRDRSAAQ